MKIELKTPKVITFSIDNAKWDSDFISKMKALQTPGMRFMTYEDYVELEIRYSDYSQVVDEFFWRLNA